MSGLWSVVALSVSVAVAPMGDVRPTADEPLVTAPPDADALTSDASSEPSAPEDATTEDGATPQGPLSLEEALLEEARFRYVDGEELFELNRYLEAATAFRRSYAAAPSGRALYASALSYEKGGEIVEALERYRRYLALPDCPTPDSLCVTQRDEARDSVAKFRPRVAELLIEVDEGVELLGIELGDRMVPPEDFPIFLAPGHYEIRERGYTPSEVRIRELDVKAGQVFSLLIVDFNAPSQPAPPEVFDPGPPSRPSNRLTEEERRRRLRIAFYGGVGMTAAAGIATGIVGGVALRAYRDQQDRCRGMNCSGTVYPLEERERVEQLRPVANALVGVTAGLGLTTVVLGLFAFTGKQGRGARASMTRVTPTPRGVRVRF